jgi:hypothetical protein
MMAYFRCVSRLLTRVILEQGRADGCVAHGNIINADRRNLRQALLTSSKCASHALDQIIGVLARSSLENEYSRSAAAMRPRLPANQRCESADGACGARQQHHHSATFNATYSQLTGMLCLRRLFWRWANRTKSIFVLRKSMFQSFRNIPRLFRGHHNRRLLFNVNAAF